MAEAVLPGIRSLEWYIESYDRIRDSIADVFDEFHDFICAFYKPAVSGRTSANQHGWNTKSGKNTISDYAAKKSMRIKENQYAAAFL